MVMSWSGFPKPTINSCRNRYTRYLMDCFTQFSLSFSFPYRRPGDLDPDKLQCLLFRRKAKAAWSCADMWYAGTWSSLLLTASSATVPGAQLWLQKWYVMFSSFVRVLFVRWHIRNRCMWIIIIAIKIFQLKNSPIGPSTRKKKKKKEEEEEDNRGLVFKNNFAWPVPDSNWRPYRC